MKSVPFSDFMNNALYGESGYYMTDRNRFGRSGDFYTSAQVSPIFGRLLALYLLKGAPSGEPLSLVEMGCGDGDLAVSLLLGFIALSDRTQKIRYAGIDRSSVAIARTQERLKSALTVQCSGDRVEWLTCTSVDELMARDSTFRGAFLIGNEVLDALPCEQLEVDLAKIPDKFASDSDVFVSRTVREGRVIENHCGDGKSFAMTYTVQPHLNASAYAEAHVFPLVQSGHLSIEGVHQFEAPIFYRPFLQSIVNTLAPRTMILLDYGGETVDVIGDDRPHGSLRGYLKHQLVSPLFSPGNVDITYDVDFSHVREILEGMGYFVEPLMRQGPFLMGIISNLDDASRVIEEGEYAALKHLVMPGGLGDRFVVCVAHRDKPTV